MSGSVIEKLITVHDTHHPSSPPPPHPSFRSSSYSTSTILIFTVLGIIIFGMIAFFVSSLKLMSMLSSSHATSTPSATTSAATAITNITHPTHVHIDHHTHHFIQHHPINPPSTVMEPVSFQIRELEGTIMLEPESTITPSTSTEVDTSQYDIAQTPHTTEVGAGYGAMADLQQLQAQAQQYRDMYPTNENMPEEYRYQNPNYAPQQAIDPNPIYGVFGPQPPPAVAAPQQQAPALYQQQPHAAMIQPQIIPVYRVTLSQQQASYMPNPPVFPQPPRV